MARSRRSPFVWIAAASFGWACNDRPATDAMLERLDRIDARLAALERRADDVPPADPAEPPEAPDDPAASQRRTPADPFGASARTTGKSLAVAVQGRGWEIDGRIVTAAQLRLLLQGIDTVTVRAEKDAAQSSIVELLEVLREADVEHIAIARLSGESDAGDTDR